MPFAYTVNRLPGKSHPPLSWDAAGWTAGQILEIAQFRPESSDHRPKAEARLLWSEKGLHGIYKVVDRYVRCVRTNYFDEVWKDSCVEFFVQPKLGKGYFNFEFNCGGAFLCYYITDHRRGPGGFAKAEKLPPEVGRTVRVSSSLPGIVEPENPEPMTWFLSFHIPVAVFEPYVGSAKPGVGERWRGNFFKCAEEVSHPHWASWAPVPELNFHLPECFGELLIAGVD